MTELDAVRLRLGKLRLCLASICLAGALAGFAPPPAPPPRQAERWTPALVRDLAGYVATIDKSQGLDPADYDLARLRKATGEIDPEELDKLATHSFLLLARDLAAGHVRPAQRRLARFPSRELSSAATQELLDEALARKDIGGTLERLAPQNAAYRALRAALPNAAPERREILRVNLERWRWMQRIASQRAIIVNIPEFRARLTDGGRVIADHRVIVGKPATPTRQFSALVTGVIFNPAWHVPQSIIAESVGRLVRSRPAYARAQGYTWSVSGGHLQVTQLPGPDNALGQMKLDMPNPYGIYMHDTPAKALFDEDQRAFSHGCIRTDQPFDLAQELLAGSEWSRSAIDDVVRGRRTVRAELDQPVPVQVVYFTAVPGPDGTIRYLPDPYGLDADVAKHLTNARSQP